MRELLLEVRTLYPAFDMAAVQVFAVRGVSLTAVKGWV